MIYGHICPCCGYDLAKDAPIMLNEFSMMGSHSQLMYRGEPLDLTLSERIVIWSVMKSYPRSVNVETIKARLDSDSEGNVVAVYLTRVRNKLRAIDAPIPFHVSSNSIIWDPRAA